MPPRNKRNAPSHRHQPSSQPQPHPQLSLQPEREQAGLPSFDQHSPPDPAYDSLTPAVFELDPPPSDPELGRQSTVIRDSRNITDHHLADPVDYARDMYGPATSGSDIDDGPASVSTSPPDPSPPRTYSIAHDRRSEFTSGRSALSRLAIADDTASDDSSPARSAGHVRSPVLAR
ncbi:hypothetical protein BD414DRAFT_66053 [Trametes punicea]|nr:hypothetical protein BD414DRAFT_66053 [Trametes punicea]